MPYVVEVDLPLPEDREAVVRSLADAFGIPRGKAERLLARIPGRVTRPVEEGEANAVARILRRTGLKATVRATELPASRAAPAGTGAAAGAATESAPPSGAEPETRSPFETYTPEMEVASGGAGTGGDAATARTPGSEEDPADASAPPHPAATRSPEERGADGRLRAVVRDEGGRAAPGAAKALGAPARSVQRGRRRGSLRRTIFTAALLPALLTFAAMAGAALWVLEPAWFSVPGEPSAPDVSVAPSTEPTSAVAADVANVAAAAFAGAAETLLDGRDPDDPSAQRTLQRAAVRARSELEAQGVRALWVTTAQGERVAGWPEEAELPAALRRALAQGAVGLPATPALEGASLAVDPLRAAGSGAGRVVIVAALPAADAGPAVSAAIAAPEGVDGARDDPRARRALWVVVAAGVVPLLFALIVGIAVSRAFGRNVDRLVAAADRIGRGDLDESVELDSNDELTDLAVAIERMRFSLREAVERLRRRS